jgi:hypothetical protein
MGKARQAQALDLLPLFYGMLIRQNLARPAHYLPQRANRKERDWNATPLWEFPTPEDCLLRYYFHIRDAKGVIYDEEGTELPDIEAARREARASARDLLGDSLDRHATAESRYLEIADENGSVIETMSVRDIIK